MSLPSISHFGLRQDILCEPDPGGRIVLWVPGARDSRVQHWERISSFPAAKMEENRGVCLAAAMSMALKQSFVGFFARAFRRGRQATEDAWITPLGELAERVGPKRTDLSLVWSNEPDATFGEPQIRDRWPHIVDCRPLGKNLFLVTEREARKTPHEVNKATYDEQRAESGEDNLAELQHPDNDPYTQAERKLAVARARRNSAAEAVALADLGVAGLKRGDRQQAVRHLEQALTLFQKSGDEAGEYDALMNLSTAYALLGKTQEAATLLEQVLARARSVGDRYSEQAALVELGLSAMSRYESRRALDYFESASQIAQQLRDRQTQAAVAWNAAICYDELGNRQKALELAHSAVEVFRELELPAAGPYAESLESFRRGETNLLAASPDQPAVDPASAWLYQEPIDVGLATPTVDDSPVRPSLLRMAFTLTRSMAKFAASGFKTVTRQVRATRLEACRQCGHHTGLRCKICGCFTAQKTWLRHEHCPTGKW